MAWAWGPVGWGWGAFVGYVVTSAFFWNYPLIIHKRKKIPFVASHISHRGGSFEGYENTIRSFRSCLEKGSDMLELDVRLTRDGKVVVFHDSDLYRIAGSTTKISEIDYARLPPIGPVVNSDTMPGESFSDDSWRLQEMRIPLLSQVFQQFPTVPINIDIKVNDDKLIKEVHQLLEEYDRKEITVWGSFDNSVCQKLHAISPDTCLFFSAWRVCVLLMCALVGILPFVPLKETHFEVLLPLYLRRRRLLEAGEISFKDSLLVWVCERFLVTRPIISHLKNRGMHVYLWVCNYEDEFALCKSLGATGIMTDRPTKLREFLDSQECNHNSG